MCMDLFKRQPETNEQNEQRRELSRKKKEKRNIQREKQRRVNESKKEKGKGRT